VQFGIARVLDAEVVRVAFYKRFGTAWRITVRYRANFARAGIRYTDPRGGWDYQYDADPGEDAFGAGGNAFDALDGTWTHSQADKWDGTAPGDAVSDPTVDPAGSSPGGVGIFGDGTSYLRIQDTGDPTSHFWRDPSNRRIYFAHDIVGDPNNDDAGAVMDDGITLTARLRIATPAHPPLDDAFPESPNPQQPWPTGGKGYQVSADARGMFGLEQKIGFLTQSTGFSLATEADTPDGVGSGLIMNNTIRNNVDTTVATPETANLVAISDQSLADWHEFWITIQSDDDNHWRVMVYRDGALTAEAFSVGKRDTSEYLRAGIGAANLVMGLSSGSNLGAVDVDFLAYKLGVHAPVPEPSALALIACLAVCGMATMRNARRVRLFEVC